MYKKPILLICFVLVLSLTANTAVAELVAYYPLDEGSGTSAADMSGQGHDGTIQGTPAWVDGPPGFGKALYYDGVSPATGWVNCGTWNPSEVTGHLSVAFWCQWDGAIPGSWQGVVAKRDYWDDTGNGAGSMWEIEVDESSQEMRFFRGGSYPGGAVLPVGEWKYIAVTFDGTTVIFYVDGVETNQGGFSFGPKTDSVIEIGCDSADGWNSFNGILDEVRIYDHALSPSEIQNLMQGVGKSEASNPSPPDNAVDVPVDANLGWTRGQYALQDDVYFGTDPCMASLPHLTTLFSFQDPLVDLPVDLIASPTAM
ncbi:MAG: LamG domain-containing protein [Planctomycetota bacterium]|jgi:hypothetical protein